MSSTFSSPASREAALRNTTGRGDVPSRPPSVDPIDRAAHERTTLSQQIAAICAGARTSPPQLPSQPDDSDNLLSYGTNDGILTEPPVASNPQPTHTPTSPQGSHAPHQIINDNSPQVTDTAAPLQLGAFVLAPLSSGDEAIIHLSQTIETVEAMQTTGYANRQEDVVIPDENADLAPAPAYQPTPEYHSPQPQSPVPTAITTDPEDISSQSSRPPSSMGPRPTSSLGTNDDNVEPPAAGLDEYGMGTKEIPDWEDVPPVPPLNKEHGSDYRLEMCILMLDRVHSYLNLHRRLLRLLIQTEQISSMY